LYLSKTPLVFLVSKSNTKSHFTSGRLPTLYKMPLSMIWFAAKSTTFEQQYGL